MDSKMAILIPGLLAMLLLISSEVTARDLKQGEVVKETNAVGDAKFVVGGGYTGGDIPGIRGGYVGGYFPGIGSGYIGGNIPGIDGGYTGGGFPGSDIPGRGFPGFFPGQRFCLFRCCLRDGLGGCIRCCTIF